MTGNFLLRGAMLVAAIGLSLPYFAAAARAQQPPQRQGPSQRANVSDKELKAFAKAYVEYQRIRQTYEPSLKNAKDAAEGERIQREANTKIKTALKKQGLDVDSYNRIFNAVNANEELRKKALNLIDQERKRPRKS